MDTDDEVRLSELLDKEDMKEYAVNKTFDSQDSPEYSQVKDGFGFGLKTMGVDTSTNRNSWKILLAVSMLIVVLSVLIIILQSVMIAHLNLFPVVCPEASTESSTTAAATNSQTGTTAPTVNNGDSNNSLSMQMSQLMHVSQDILSVSEEHFAYSQNSSEWLYQVVQTTQGSAQKLTEIVRTLSNLQDTNIASEVIANDILSVVQELLKLQNDSLIFSSHLPISCQDIKAKQPDSPSGYYHINSQIVYCEMGTLCNSTEGGWTRLAYLDMTDATVDCPTGFKLFNSNGVRACGRPSGGAGCSSITHPSYGISYTEVCGRAVGYQYYTPNAVDTRFVSAAVHNDINAHYLDGVSITRGSPRKHIWSLLNGLAGSVYDPGNCPCNDPAPPSIVQDIQSFVGSDYFCESGAATNWQPILYTSDPLWDGQGCGTQEGPCCSAPGLPWFHKTLTKSTTDYLEVRVCGDQDTGNEDTPIGFFEIYVK